MRAAAFLVFAIILSTGALAAQEQRDDGFMVHQIQVCPPENQEALNEFTDEVAAPILNDLVDEGMVRSWYHLMHAWGDEWNDVIVTVVDDHRAWLDFWSEYLARLDDASPNWREELLPLCTMHRDNMYVVRNGG